MLVIVMFFDKGINILFLFNKEIYCFGFNGQVFCEVGECFILLFRCYFYCVKIEYIVFVINCEDFV